jgi:hypothetical protein
MKLSIQELENIIVEELQKILSEDRAEYIKGSWTGQDYVLSGNECDAKGPVFSVYFDQGWEDWKSEHLGGKWDDLREAGANTNIPEQYKSCYQSGYRSAAWYFTPKTKQVATDRAPKPVDLSNPEFDRLRTRPGMTIKDKNDR